MSTDSLHLAGVVLITVPAIAFGGARLLTMIFRPRAQSPNRLVYLVPLGGLSLSVGAVILGLGLLSV